MCHSRLLSPYPPHSGGGALGEAGIQKLGQQRIWMPGA
jgi:hypothetical protein